MKYHFDAFSLNVSSQGKEGDYFAEMENGKGHGAILVFDSLEHAETFGRIHNEKVNRVIQRQIQQKDEEVLLIVQIEPGAPHVEIKARESEVPAILAQMNAINAERNRGYNRSKLFK